MIPLTYDTVDIEAVSFFIFAENLYAHKIRMCFVTFKP